MPHGTFIALQLRLFAVPALFVIAAAVALVILSLSPAANAQTSVQCPLGAPTAAECFRFPDGSTFQQSTDNGNLVVQFDGPTFGGSGTLNAAITDLDGNLVQFSGTQVLNGVESQVSCVVDRSINSLVSGSCGQFLSTALGLPQSEAPQAVATALETTSSGIVSNQVRATNALIANRIRTVAAQYIRARLPQTSSDPDSHAPRFGTGLSAGSQDARFGVWIDGSVTLVSNDHASVLSDGKTEVALVGADYRLREDLIVGVSAGYQGAQLSVGAIRGRRDSNGYVVTPYASYILGSNMSVDVNVSVGGSTTDVESNITGNRALGHFDSRRVGAGGNWNIYEGLGDWFLTGFAGYNHAWEFQDDFTDSTGNRIDNGTVTYGVLRFGGEAAYRLGAFEPYILSVFELETTDPEDADRETLVVGGGLRFYHGALSAAVEFNAQTLRSQESGYTFGLNLRYVF